MIINSNRASISEIWPENYVCSRMRMSSWMACLHIEGMRNIGTSHKRHAHKIESIVILILINLKAHHPKNFVHFESSKSLQENLLKRLIWRQHRSVSKTNMSFQAKWSISVLFSGLPKFIKNVNMQRRICFLFINALLFENKLYFLLFFFRFIFFVLCIFCPLDVDKINM